MIRESEFKNGNPRSVTGVRGYGLLYNFFVDSNGELMGREQKEDVPW